MIVAIDGPAGSGKSTTARLVAERLGYVYLDTGAMYRAIGLAMIRRDRLDDQAGGVELLDSIRLDIRPDDKAFRVFLNDEDVTSLLRTADVGSAASRVAQWPAVREKLVAEQRRIARGAVEEGSGVVLDGRDIGTVVFPDADVKFFVQADAEVRARRRFDELTSAGHKVSFHEVLAEIKQRDKQDAHRAVAPLRVAGDAVLIDTTHVGIEEQVALVIEEIRERGHKAMVN